VECIDCGACVPVCPVSAIFALDDLPEKWKRYADINTSYGQGGKVRPHEDGNIGEVAGPTVLDRNGTYEAGCEALEERQSVAGG